MNRNVDTCERLRVRVNDELVLDAGTSEELAGQDGLELIIRPPEIPLFQQVLAYLRGKPDPPSRVVGSTAGREGVAAATVSLRWGSYLAVLLDRDKPVWPAARSEGTSRISDEEMARINIEASAACAEWIDLYRADDGGRLYAKLVGRALGYLPFPQKTSKLETGPFAALADPEIGDRLARATDPARVARLRADAERHPSRLFANALVNVAWRNGPVENVHAGLVRGYPLRHRRATPAEERQMMRFTSAGMALGMSVCRQLATERSRRPWPEQVLPYGLAPLWLVTPSGWTLTEVSREVRLPACPAEDRRRSSPAARNAR